MKSEGIGAIPPGETENAVEKVSLFSDQFPQIIREHLHRNEEKTIDDIIAGLEQSSPLVRLIIISNILGISSLDPYDPNSIEQVKDYLASSLELKPSDQYLNYASSVINQGIIPKYYHSWRDMRNATYLRDHVEDALPGYLAGEHDTPKTVTTGQGDWRTSSEQATRYKEDNVNDSEGR
ncbi:MAG: hypothetical protein WC080_01770 [Patescibacteria group bacterium]|jgi:hypothetical protein